MLKWIMIYGLILGAMLGGVSCKEKSLGLYSEMKGNVATLRVNAAKETLASELFDSLSYVVLDDTNEESLIGGIDKLECVDSSFFIMDKKTNMIHKFNKKGNFLFSIGKIGNGPGEYIGLTDFSVNSEKRELFILDRTGRKILVYDFEGRFLYKMPIEVMASKICAINDGYALYTSGSDYFTDKKEEFGYNLFLYDNSNRLCGKYFPYNPQIDDVIQERNFDYNIGDSILLYHQSVCDTIYLLKSKEGYKKLKIDFGSHSLPFDKITPKNFREYQRRSDYAFITSTAYVKNYLFINYAFKKRTHCFIYNIKSDMAYNISYLLNDMDETALSMIWPLEVVGNQVYYLKSASDLLEDNRVVEMCINGKKITKESNPVLVIGHLK